jgi:predicted permease
VPDAFILPPVFALIATGFAVCRTTPLGRPVWDGAERLVYHLLFPALLFSAIVRNPLRPQDALTLAGGTLLVTGLGIVLAVRMGGHGPYVAGLVTLSTLLGMASLPLALAAWSTMSALPALR